MDKVKMVGVMEKGIEEGRIDGLSKEVVEGLLKTPLAKAKRGENGTGRDDTGGRT